MATAIKGRGALAIGVFLLLVVVVLLGRWFETQRSAPQRAADKTTLIHVTNAGDRGPGTLREAMFLAAGATGPTRVSIEVPVIALETALPAFVNGRGVTLVGQAGGAAIDAHALGAGPVLDVAGADTSIEGITIKNCPATAILVRAVRFRLSGATLEACDLGVEVADNASDILLERNKFVRDRLGVRFAASGRNSTVANNEFSNDKDSGLWAVRSAPDSHDEVIAIRDNKFTEDGDAIVAGNIPVLVEKNDFINDNEAAVHLVGSGATVRSNHINGGASMGIIAENARNAIIEDNELEGMTAYGVMVRGSSNVLVRGNRLHNCGYGIAFVLGDARAVSTAIDNTIIEPKFNGIDVIGDSPHLRRNQVLHARAFAIHVEDFQPPNQQKVVSKPFLENNNFDNTPAAGVSAPVKAQTMAQ